jgi:hypothetical protein
LQQTGLSLACGSLWRPQLNTGTFGRQADEAPTVIDRRTGAKRICRAPSQSLS